MSVKVKICGLSEADHVACAVGAGADYLGFVFYDPSPRNVGTDIARALAAPARGRARIVALTVDADDAQLAAISAAVKPDFFQAHGDESPARVREIKAMTGVPVIKAIKVSKASDIEAARSFEGVAEMILFDAKAPDTLEGALPGGNGLQFDWSLLSSDGRPVAFMLSGGLDAGNVCRAVAVTGAPIVDVSSGVETVPGRKDTAKITKFIEAAKSCG